MTHPKTGHDCATIKPWDERNGWTRPEELTIHVKRGMDCDTDPDYGCTCNRGTEHCWVDHEAASKVFYACITSADGIEWLMHGDSVGAALFMAYDVVQMMYEECKPGETHCYCRDVTWSSHWAPEPPNHLVGLAKRCCICEDKAGAGEFDVPTSNTP
jgi:hypothetical protein